MFHQVRSFWKSFVLSEYKNHRCQVCHKFVPSLSSVYTNVNLKTVLWFSSASQNSSLLRVLSHVLDCQLLKHVHMVSFKKAAQPSFLTSSPGINHPSPQVLASAAPTPVQCVEVSPGDQWLIPKQHQLNEWACWAVEGDSTFIHLNLLERKHWLLCVYRWYGNMFYLC